MARLGGEQRLVGVAEHDLRGRSARVGLVGVAEEHRRAAVLEHQPQLGSGQPDVERHEHGAGGEHAEVRLEQLVGVPAEPRHPVARAHAEAVAERPGQPVRSGRRTRGR